VHAVQRQVRSWLDEMVPQFNLLAYYAVGYRLARMVGYSLYRVHLDRASWEAARRALPPGAAVVLASNHRSNMDFVVTGFMVSKSVQVSYAVGEWARVWPLDRLFRSFGSYFVRRGEKDPLYHRTLEAYIQLVTRQGVTQAVFPEGGLSRDGRLRPAKLGLLDHMARAKLDPAFTRPLAFVPVGINFDRVLEDEVLVRETVAGDHPLRRRTVAQKARRLLALAGRAVSTAPVALARIVLRRPRRHGVCAIQFGAPIVFDDWAAANPHALRLEDRHARWEALRPFGDTLMHGIAAVVPATPVPLACSAAASLGPLAMEQGVPASVFAAAVRDTIARAESEGRPVVTGDAATATGAEPTSDSELGAVDDALRASEAAESVLRHALAVTSRRGILVLRDGAVRTLPGRWELVLYYAHSIAAPVPGPAPEPPEARRPLVAA
jgi:glycerol-3-phosphate O-acyltransferase